MRTQAFLLAACSLLAASCGSNKEDLSLHRQYPYISDPGNNWFAQVKSNYERGSYDDFISDVDVVYQTKKVEGSTENSEAVEIMEVLGAEETKEKTEQARETGREYLQELAKLNQEKKESLTRIANLYPKVHVSKIIREAYDESALTEEQRQASQKLAMLEFTFQPGDNDTLKGEIRELLREYSIKKLFPDMARSQGRIDQEKAREQYVALQIDKFEKLKALCARYKDKEMSKLVNDAFLVTKQQLIRRRAMQYLNNLGRGYYTPEDRIAGLVKKLMSDYLAKRTALYQNYFGSSMFDY